MFSGFYVKVPAILIIAIDRGKGGSTHANHENSKLDRPYKHLNSALPKICFGQKCTASPCGTDTLVRELRNLSSAPANQNLVVSYAKAVSEARLR